jgi:type I restriction enzyme R subunit
MSERIPQADNGQYDAYFSALHLLCALGWTYLPPSACLARRGGKRDVLLKATLLEVLQTRRFEYNGELHPLSANAIDHIVRELSSASSQQGLSVANERLYEKISLGVTVTEFMADGKKHHPTIRIIDWHNPKANRFEVTDEFEVLSAQGTHMRRLDIVGFVNGIPLVAIEAKRPTSGNSGGSMIADGISRQLQNQRPDEVPLLYVYAQLLFSISHTDGRYGTTNTEAKFWARWRDQEFDEAYCVKMKNTPLSTEVQAALFSEKSPQLRTDVKRLWAAPMLATEQDRLLISLLTPRRLLEFLHVYVLFDRKAGKLVARYQQFFGIRALIEKIGKRRPDGGREGGVIWHTTGSGKSFAMVFLTKALLLHESLKVCRVLVVTDRLDLEEQLSMNFISGGAFGTAAATRKVGEKAKVSSGRDLARRIGSGSERIIFTLVHKFNTASKLPECFNPTHNLIVLVDEGHRSHSGETHERMRRVLPRAAYIAFTGTPLLKNEKTTNKFGAIVHAYTMQRAVDDETVAPLLYEERIPELHIDEAAVNNWFDKITANLSASQKTDLKEKFANKDAIYSAANRIELIAWDIAVHFSENIKKVFPGLKGQLATASKQDAVRYHHYLNQTGLVTSAVVISAPEEREGNGDIDESTAPEVQKWWKENVGNDQEAYERQVLDRFSCAGAPDLLIVVDRLLTGFDEPANAVLYIDKPLKEHGLIQAIARVNRLHAEKRYGMLVDYRGILKQLDTAIHAYQLLENHTQGGYDLADIEGMYRQFSVEYGRLPGLRDALWAMFTGVANRQDMERYRQVLMPHYAEDGQGESIDTRQKLREDFYVALTEFGLCLQVALSSRTFFEDERFSEPDIAGYKEDLQFFSSLRHVARQDALETVGNTVYEEQVRRLVDQQLIGYQAREPEEMYIVHKRGPDEEPSTWSEEKARNEIDLIRARLRKTIEQDLADDPYAQKVFAELLKQAIAETTTMFAHPRKQYALFKKFAEQVALREVTGMPDSLGDQRLARTYFGIFRIVLGDEYFNSADTGELQQYVEQALNIDRVVHNAVAENSLNPQNIESAIRKALLPDLFAVMGLEKAKETIEQVIQVTRVGLARGAL